MKISYEEFENIVTKYYNFKIENDLYLEPIPNDIKAFVYSNTYVSNVQKQLEITLKLYIGERLYNLVDWFLYMPESSFRYELAGQQPNATSNGNKYWINDLDTFLNHAKKEYFNY
jgi:hypothetical protein